MPNLLGVGMRSTCTSLMARSACLVGVLACLLVPASAGAAVGTISTFAGSPVFGPVSGTSIGAGGGTIGDVASATLGGTSYVYYAGAGQNVVRRIDLATDQEQVVAGDGGYGAPVEGSVATATTVGPADGVAVDSSGDMAILAEDQRVLFVPAISGTYFNIAMSAGDIYNLSSIVAAQAIALSPQGNLAYSYDGVIGFVSIATATRTVLSVTGSINNQAVAVDAAGDIAFFGPDGDEVELAPASSTGAYTGSSAKGSYFGISMPTAGTGYALVDECDDDNCGANPGNGGYAPDATLASPWVLAFDTQGDLTIGDGGDYGLRFLPAADGTYYGQSMFVSDIYTIGGAGAGAVANGATATNTAFVPTGVGVAANGDVLADAGLKGLLRVSKASDAIETVAGNGSYGYDGDGIEGATAQFGGVDWVTSDAGGDVAILESADSRVRFIPALSGTYFGQSMTGGDIYTVAGDGTPLSMGSSGIGGPATAAKFDTFQLGGGITLDANGDLAIADPGNDRICFVPAQSGEYYGQAMSAGDVYTVGGSLDGTDAVFDAAGNMFVADDSVQELAAGASTPTTLPGSTGVEAHDIAVDAQDDVAVTAFNRDTVMLIPAQSGAYFGQPALSAHTATTIAGNGTEGYSGDGAAATSAELDTPVGLAFDAAGDLAIAQEGGEQPPRHHHDAVRFLPRASGSFYGQSMSVGDIYTIAGDGTSGFLGDGGPGTAAELAAPSSVAAMPGEDVLIADQGNNRVREVFDSEPPPLQTALFGNGSGSSGSNTTSSGSQVTGVVVLAQGPPQPSPVLACSKAQVALIDVIQRGSHVQITGAARLALAGKRVNIKFLATHKIVASATIAADGTFSASAPLPPAGMRESNLARYQAIVGSLRSANLKLDRRMYMVSATRSGSHALLSGYVTGSFKVGTPVKIILRVTCSEEKVLSTVKLSQAGTFSATVPAPTGAASQIAVYRASTVVLKHGHPERTFTLPTPLSG
jgi:hypothetical protein